MGVKKTIEISVIVPCYNEEAALPFFYDKASEVLTSIGVSYELIFVNDGSKDRTLEELRELSKKDSSVKYFSFSRNFGKEAAIYAGLKASKGRYVAMMDADLQDPPELLPKMYELMRTGEYDNVTTRRQDRVGEPPIRSFFARTFYKVFNKMSEVDLMDGARDFSLMSRPMVNAVLELGEYNRFSKGLFRWVGFRTHWLSYENVERVAGETKWSFWGLFRYAVDGVLNFSQAPLHFSTVFGILMTMVSFVIMVALVVKKLIMGDYNLSGWTSLVSIVLFMGGIQLLSLGILGQYVARIFMETKHRPLYIISETNEDVDGIESR